jgi:pimeloyl-ACP methyl ester carboxylesterase
LARIEVNGTTIAYDDRGHGGPSFVFIHGWACDRSFWQPQFEEFSRDHRCVALDLRGRGDSPAVPPYDSTTAAADVAAIIQALGLGPVILVGHSLGGLVALLVNDSHPELVQGIVLGDSPLTAAGRGGFAQTVDAIRQAGSLEPVRSFIESFFVEATPHSVQKHVRDVMLGCSPEIAAGMLDNGTVFVERLDDLVREADKKPFMAIWAERPLGSPERMRELTMFVRQEPIAGAGHFFQLEQPEITNALLHAFVDDVRRDPRLPSVS